jgi:hypothetical protein
LKVLTRSSPPESDPIKPNQTSSQEPEATQANLIKDNQTQPNTVKYSQTNTDTRVGEAQDVAV